MSRSPNLLPASWITRRDRDRRLVGWMRVVVPTAAASACVIAWCLVTAATHGASATRLVRSAQQKHDQRRETLDQLRVEYNSALITRAEASRVHRQPDWSLFLAIVGDVVGPEVTLEALELMSHNSTTDRFDLRLVGTAPSLVDATRMAQRLESLEIFGRVTLGETTRSKDGSAEFTILARLRASHDTVATGGAVP